MVHIALASDFAERWGKLKDMEERVGRKGFDPLKVLGKADHEIRGLACNLMPDGALFVAAGDKAGGIYVTCVDVLTGETRAGRSFRKSPPLTPSSSEHRVVDVLQIAGSGADAWLIAGTRGNGAWRVPVQAILSDDDDLPYEQLTGSQGVVRRLMLDGNILWAAIDTRLMAWTLDNADAQLSVRLELGARITAMVHFP